MCHAVSVRKVRTDMSGPGAGRERIEPTVKNLGKQLVSFTRALSPGSRVVVVMAPVRLHFRPPAPIALDEITMER
jgi:hypothetical protein